MLFNSFQVRIAMMFSLNVLHLYTTYPVAFFRLLKGRVKYNHHLPILIYEYTTSVSTQLILSQYCGIIYVNRHNFDVKTDLTCLAFSTAAMAKLAVVVHLFI